MRKNKILRYAGITLLVIVGILFFLSVTGTVAHAAGLVDDTVDAANAYSKYPLENYQLDFYVDSSWDWQEYSVRLVCHHKFCLDGQHVYFQRYRVRGAGSLQAGLYLGYRKRYR